MEGASVDALFSLPGPCAPVVACVSFLGWCGHRLHTKVAAWTPCAGQATLLVLRKDNVKLKTTANLGDEDPVAVAAVEDTEAGPSVVVEDLFPLGWRAHAWRAPTRTRIVDASGQALKALARLPLTLHVHDKPMHFPFIVAKRLSAPLIIGGDLQHLYMKAIFPQDRKIVLSTGTVSDILGYHLGAR